MFMVVLAVLSIVLAFPAPLFQPFESEIAARWVSWFAALAATVAPAATAAWVRADVLRQLERRPTDPASAQFALQRGSSLVFWLIGATQGALLLATIWQPLCRAAPLIGDWYVVPSLLALTPFFVALLSTWTTLYPADHALRAAAIEVHLLHGRPVRPAWTLATYLSQQLRHQLLFILVPMLLIVLARDVIDEHSAYLRSTTDYAHTPDLLLGVSAIVVALLTPEILRHVWRTQRLAAGPLRDRLVSLGRRIGLRYRELLVWRAGGTLVNAAVMGVVPPLRYVLVTEAMLERMDDLKVEAVFGHEAGHVKRRHIWHLLFFAAISGCLVTIFSVRSDQFRAVDETSSQLWAAILAAVLLFKWGVVFGWLSRGFERQADLYGARVLAAGGLPCHEDCALHGSQRDDTALDVRDSTEAKPRTPAAPGLAALRPSAPLCRTAAHVYAATLTDVALLNAIPPEAPSWRHGSIAGRARTVQACAANPSAGPRFERRMAVVTFVVFIVAVSAGVWTAWELRLLEVASRIWQSVAAGP